MLHGAPEVMSGIVDAVVLATVAAFLQALHLQKVPACMHACMYGVKCACVCLPQDDYNTIRDLGAMRCICACMHHGREHAHT